jgi:hypothetical protein
MLHARRLAMFALATLLAAPFVTAAGPAAAAEKREAATSAPAPAKRASYRQFTGTVVALDAATITVEKPGKTPKQMVFARHAGMRSAGDVEKDARVTVYWRDEAGRPVAHRVVVKTATADASR